MDIKSFPNNQDEFQGAEYMMKFLHGRTSGVFGAENNLKVVATESELAVKVTKGVGWMSNSKGDGVVIWNDIESLKLKLDLADASKTRIDRVVVSWQTTDYIARPTVSILKGIAGGTAPALTNSDTMRQISLAQIIIPAGALTITASMVKDERMDEAVCGIVNETIKIDTSGIQAQANGLINDMTAEFNAWFETAKDTIGTDTAGKLLNLINAKPNPIKTYSVLIPSSNWGDTNPYSQTISVEGLLDEGLPKYYIDIAKPNFIQASKEFEKITRLQTGNGKIIVTAKDFKPETDLNIKIEVMF